MAIRKVSDIVGTPTPGKPGTPTPSPAPAPAPAPMGGATKAPGRALVPTQAPAAPQAAAASRAVAAPPDGMAALEAELNGINDTLGVSATLVASLADRVDAQTELLERVHRTATEARQAAFHAKAQTDPDLFQEAVNAAAQDALRRLGAVAAALTEERHEARQASQAVQKELGTLKTALHVVLSADIGRQERRKRQLPLLAAGALLLVLALSLLLPRFVAAGSWGCWMLGGEWRLYSNGCLIEAPEPVSPEPV